MLLSPLVWMKILDPPHLGFFEGASFQTILPLLFLQYPINVLVHMRKNKNKLLTYSGGEVNLKPFFFNFLLSLFLVFY